VSREGAFAERLAFALQALIMLARRPHQPTLA